MIHSRWRAARLLLLAVAAAGMVWASGAHADQPEPVAAPAPSAQDLEQRVRELEDIVRQLKAAQPGDQPVLIQGEGEEGVDPAAKPVAPLPSKEVQKLVDNYLKTKDAAAKKTEEQKKKDAAAQGSEVGSDLTFKATWKDGLNFETADKAFRVHVGGRMQADFGFFNPDTTMQQTTAPTIVGNPSWLDGADFRRARFRIDGTAWEVVDWVLEYDFAAFQGANNNPTATDVYFDLKGLPYGLGTFRVGHFKEPFNLEDYGTPDGSITFMERSAANDAFSPNRNMGMMLFNSFFDDRLAVAAGFFKNNNDNATGNAFDYSDGAYAFTARAAWIPWYEQDGRYWVLFGGAYSHRTLDPEVSTSRLRFSSRIPIRAGSVVVVDTNQQGATGANVSLIPPAPGTLLTADSFQQFNLQAAAVFGPLSFQSELYYTLADDVRRGAQFRDPGFYGWYAQATYFLTGEHRNINRKTGIYGRIRPHEPFFFVKDGNKDCGRGSIFGKGAWELAVRFDDLDLSSPDLNSFGRSAPFPGSVAAYTPLAGRLQDVLFGVNWYINSTTKIQFNYARAWRDLPPLLNNSNGPASNTRSGSGTVDALGIRCSYDF